MKLMSSRLGKVIVGGLVGVVGVGLAITSAFLVYEALPAKAQSAATAQAPREAPERPRRLDAETIAVPQEVFKSLDIRTSRVQPCTKPRTLPPLPGCLAADSNRLPSVRPRFAGEIVALGSPSEEGTTQGSPDWSPSSRPIRFGDRVRKDQLLAVVWSKDLGEKKSELVDALSRLKLDQEVLERLQDLFKRGATTERSVREAERAVHADHIAITKAERTLRSWRLSDDEIAAVRAEANRPAATPGKGRQEDEQWARVEVRAPMDGVVLEKNANVGDLVDTSTVLFRIGDLSRLTVWVHIYEEDLPSVQMLPRPIPWTIRLPSMPSRTYPGTLEQIGELIDPNQHTALLSGQVENSRGELRIGQYVTATLELPPPSDEVEVPATALVEDGRDSIVFVQPNPSKPHFVRRHVTVARRMRDVVYLKTYPTEEARASWGVRVGEDVVVGGAVLLKDALAELPLPPNH
jgi:cobalt-zinc-cadmium efflux system membrane fusion protein